MRVPTPSDYSQPLALVPDECQRLFTRGCGIGWWVVGWRARSARPVRWCATCVAWHRGGGSRSTSPVGARTGGVGAPLRHESAPNCATARDPWQLVRITVPLRPYSGRKGTLIRQAAAHRATAHALCDEIAQDRRRWWHCTLPLPSRPAHTARHQRRPNGAPPPREGGASSAPRRSRACGRGSATSARGSARSGRRSRRRRGRPGGRRSAGGSS